MKATRLYVLPYLLIEKIAVGKATQAAIIRMLLSEVIRNSPFDEAAYLAEFPDVAEAVTRGEWPDGRSHFAAVGYFEGRWAPPFKFSEEWYLQQNPDVARAIEVQDLHSGEEHYHVAGIFEWRSPAAAASADVEAWKQASAAVAEERQTGFLERNKPVFERWRALKTTEPEVTPALFPVGALSPRGDMILGRDGTAFLIGGADTPLPEYGGDPEEAAERADQILSELANDQARFAAAGIRYLQLIIPEKLSVFADAFPVDITVPTPLLALVEAGVAAAPALAAAYISCFELFNSDPDWRETFRPVDKHLAPYGAYRLSQAILARLNLPPLPDLRFDQPRRSTADMSDRFVGLMENYHECDTGWAPITEKMSESRRTLGDIGKRQSWRCGTAPRLKVVVFGNSYFDFVERGQYCLSWWMARLFSDYEFIWMPRPDFAIIEELKPDVVICQAAERFLHRLPNG